MACCTVACVKWPFVIWVALAAGCGDHELEQMSVVRDEVCSCKTIPCAEAALAKVPARKVESNTRAQRVAREMLDCLAELYNRDRPTLDPDALLDR
jgi:hypothetical protein